MIFIDWVPFLVTRCHFCILGFLLGFWDNNLVMEPCTFFKFTASNFQNHLKSLTLWLQSSKNMQNPNLKFFTNVVIIINLVTSYITLYLLMPESFQNFNMICIHYSNLFGHNISLTNAHHPTNESIFESLYQRHWNTDFLISVTEILSFSGGSHWKVCKKVKI